MKRLFFLVAILLLSLAGFLLLKNNSKELNLSKITKTQNDKQIMDDIPVTTVIAKNLDVPWAIAFLPGGNMMVTERRGKVKVINQATGEQKIIAKLNDVTEVSESGLLGIALHPNFEKNKFVYLYYTQGVRGTSAKNRVVRYVFDGQSLSNQKVIVDGIPSAPNHDGGRIKFGPDGYLYITTGEAQNPKIAQDTNSLGGKILRVTDEGKQAPNNPFNNLIYSYGHRNPQGIAWDDQGRLWATEHGPSGGKLGTGNDEINLIEAGKNYGWPIIQGSQTRKNMVTPVLNSTPSITWAPSGAAYLNGSIYFAGLRGQALYEAVIDNTVILSQAKNLSQTVKIKELKTHFKKEFGRLRELIIGPDNMLYITTSNRDGRGIPDLLNDDRIIRVNPEKL